MMDQSPHRRCLQETGGLEAQHERVLSHIGPPHHHHSHTEHNVGMKELRISREKKGVGVLCTRRRAGIIATPRN